MFFPREWALNPESPYLKIGHHDVPWDDPMILRACLDGMPRPAKMTTATPEASETPLAANSNIPVAALAARS